MNEQQIRATALDAAIRLGFTAIDPKRGTETALYLAINIAEWIAEWISTGESGDLSDLPLSDATDSNWATSA